MHSERKTERSDGASAICWQFIFHELIYLYIVASRTSKSVEQGTCIHLGNCDIGCDVNARNTPDRNYIAWAEKHHAEVRPLHLVNDIIPITEGDASGYHVSYDEL